MRNLDDALRVADDGVPEVARIESWHIELLDDIEFSSPRTADNRRGTLHLFDDKGRVTVIEHRVVGGSRLFHPHIWQIRRVYKGGKEILRQAGLVMPPVPMPVHPDEQEVRDRRAKYAAMHPDLSVQRALPSPERFVVRYGDVLGYAGKGHEVKARVESVIAATRALQEAYDCRYCSNRSSKPVVVRQQDVRRIWREDRLVAIHADALREVEL